MNEQVIDEISKWQLTEFIPSLKSVTASIVSVELFGCTLVTYDKDENKLTRQELTETQRHYVECLLKVNAQHKNDAETR